MAAKTILNALGKALSYSGASTKWLSAAGLKSGSTLLGSTGNDSMYADGAVASTMSGGAGDDIYYVYSSLNHVAESVGGGVDTISTWMSYTLPDNFENLTVTGNGSYAFGNKADNIITGGTGSQTIDGGAGNDVLIGGGGADTFLVTKGNGSDVITDFGSDDTIRLNQYGFSSFSQMMTHVTQQGTNLKIDLGGGESLVLANKTATDLHANQFQLGLDRSDLTQTFSDDFNSLSLTNGTTGTWDAQVPWGTAKGGTLDNNGELEWYINPSYAGTSSVNPFSVSNGVLTISAKKASSAVQAQTGHSYTSGMLTTDKTFSQTYGYFEIRADMPNNQGVWPAFWLLPADGSWPPELDVVEMLGQSPNTIDATVHSAASGTHTVQSTLVNVPTTDGFHNYGVLWQQNTITWYFDDVAVAQVATPSDMHDPMYMLVNLAVGGIAGTPADGLPQGSDMKIDYIKAYSLNDAPVSANLSSPTVAHAAHNVGVM